MCKVNKGTNVFLDDCRKGVRLVQADSLGQRNNVDGFLSLTLKKKCCINRY